MNETSERFLVAMLERIGAERIVEIHLFPPIRQGQIETGVAVVAATRLAERESERAESEAPREPPGSSPEEVSPYDDETALTTDLTETASPVPRLEVLTAWYRLTRKGPDRGKWEVDLKSEADAPLATVGAVVRGVQQRLGEAIEPERFSAARLAALRSEPLWQSSPS